MSSDLETLTDMGFDRERSEIAIKKGGNLQGAIDWLEANQEKSIEEIKGSTNQDEDEEGAPPLQPGEEAKSLVCNECGKKFRSHAQAEFHASKTEHTDFSESTEEVAPLTEEQKKEKLEALRLKLAEKRAGQSEQDKVDKKRNEEIRKKATKEQQDIKEELQKKERLKEAEKKKRERQEDIEAKRRIQAKIQADKDERKRKAEQEKAQRTGQTFPTEPVEKSMSASAQQTVQKQSSASHTQARLRLTTEGGAVQKTFPAETTLFEVAHAVAEEKGIEVQSFQSNFPKKTFDQTDFGMTLKEAGFVPSAALIVK